ncbi:sugar ABC transporter permease [Litorilinea aerophila]|uniref:Sugar ABC transporter permease n=1 Tax=Litorilinea aerophila TaxID=1204385 RepID=A0A540VA41_9CHLR|nr:sugar ABC transporter permease [Litorilinea aerophila]MCC9078511.1 sugar ABC transporter permease [Litorilinea aerophila]OUC07042.1 ABC transporter permease [Litorilinea aerophila]GIV80356.1 MAG: spermidine/putrescine ABC transporter permease [Litorilinea sp.]
MQTLSALLQRKPLTLQQREQVDFYIAIAPWLIGLIFFTGGPVLASIAFSFTNWTGLTTLEWVGLENFRKLLFEDELFWTATYNTFYYSFGAVTLGTLGALVVALLLNQKLPGTTLLRVVYYMPSIASGVAVAILWIWLFNPQVGLVNYLLSLVGIKGPLWLASQQWALPALILKSTWGIGANMIIILAGLQGIPVSLYEAARIDGANPWHEFRHVTIPMLSPVLFFVIVISTINSFQILTDVLVMTQGGPGTATFVYVYYIYQAAFQYLKMGYASALAWILFLIILALTLLQLWGSKRWVYYEGGER